MPAAGDDGAAGLAALSAIRLAIPRDRLSIVDTSSGGFQNPHRDEGSDNVADVFGAPSIVARFAADPSIAGAIGGLRRNVGDADATAAERAALPMLVLSRSTRPRSAARSAFCLCMSPGVFISMARQIAAMRFGPRVLVVFVGETQRLAVTWAPSLRGATTARSSESPARLAARARSADAVLILADARPAILMRARLFRAAPADRYLQQLVHRGYLVAPEGAPLGDVVVLSETAMPNPGRRAFARRFHAAAGYQPPEEALRAYAAAQILLAAGGTRERVRNALRTQSFATAAGRVRFDADGYWSRSVLEASQP